LRHVARLGLLAAMANERPRLNIWLNIFIVAGVLVVAVIQSKGVLPEDNIVIVGIAYFAGGAVGALLYAALSDLRDRFVNPKS
jgi:drug/metabolite transporter (DMT)-like permease